MDDLAAPSGPLARLVSALTGRPFDPPAADTLGFGTFEGRVSPNMYVPAFGRDGTPVPEETLRSFLAIAGKDLNQDAMAASQLTRPSNPANPQAWSVLLGLPRDTVRRETLQRLHERLGVVVNARGWEGGVRLDILPNFNENLGGFDPPPPLSRIEEALDDALGPDAPATIRPAGYDSRYVNSDEYDAIIGEANRGTTAGNLQRGSGPDPVRPGSGLDDLARARADIQAVAARRDRHYESFVAANRRWLDGNGGDPPAGAGGAPLGPAGRGPTPAPPATTAQRRRRLHATYAGVPNVDKQAFLGPDVPDPVVSRWGDPLNSDHDAILRQTIRQANGEDLVIGDMTARYGDEMDALRRMAPAVSPGFDSGRGEGAMGTADRTLRYAHYSLEQKSAAARLRAIPNIGPAMADDLLRLGVTRQEDLVGRNADGLYDALCQLDGIRHDPCLHDTFAAAVDFAEGGPARPWWTFTPERKTRANRTNGGEPR